MGIFIFLFCLLFKVIPGVPIWDEAYYLGQSLLDISFIKNGDYSQILRSEYKATVFSLIGSAFGILISEDESVFKFLTNFSFFLILIVSLFKLLNLYFGTKKSILISSFVLTLPPALNAYPLYMRDIPFTAMAILSIFFVVTWKEEQSKMRTVSSLLSILLCLLLRPVFSVVYFFIPSLVFCFPGIKYQRLSGISLILLLSSFLLESGLQVTKINPGVIHLSSEIIGHIPSIQLVLFFLLFLISIFLFVKKESKLFLYGILIPLIGYWIFLKGKLYTFYLFLINAIFSGFAKDLGTFTNGTSDIFSKVVQSIISYQSLYFLLLFLSAFRYAKLKNNQFLKLILVFISVLLLFFHAFQPAHDFRQFLGIYFVTFIFLFVQLGQSEYRKFFNWKVLCSLVGLNIILFTFNYGTLFRKVDGYSLYEPVIEEIMKNNIETDAMITLFPTKPEMVDVYSLRYLSIKKGNDWRFLFFGSHYPNVLDQKLKIKLSGFHNWPGTFRYFLLGPMINGSIPALENKVLTEREKKIVKSFLRLHSQVEEQLEVGINLLTLKRFTIQGHGDFVLFKSLVD
ncbi:MAG: hypothetical protein ACJAS4_001435 [Bacteriovoracaceae bacterium]|jgi:hypothetical protein